MLSKDANYLAWIRTQECVGPSITECNGRIEAHHVTGKGMGGWKQDDRDTVPLCLTHHRQLHNDGRLKPFDAEETKLLLIEKAHHFLKRYLDGLHRP